MSPHRRPAGAPGPGGAPDDDLAAHITRALQARAAAAPDAAAVTARLEDELARRDADGRAPVDGRVLALRRGGKIAAAGVVTGTIAVAVAGAAAAANPYTDMARAVETAAQSVGINWSPLPDGYTRAQHDAFWGSYSSEDVSALSALWATDAIETKARAGQMLIEGEPLPLEEAYAAAPKYAAEKERSEALDAFWAAGYTYADLQQVLTIWEGDELEVKTRIGRTVIEGGYVPVAPSGTPALVED